MKHLELPLSTCVHFKLISEKKDKQCYTKNLTSTPNLYTWFSYVLYITYHNNNTEFTDEVLIPLTQVVKSNA